MNCWHCDRPAHGADGEHRVGGEVGHGEEVQEHRVVADGEAGAIEDGDECRGQGHEQGYGRLPGHRRDADRVVARMDRGGVVQVAPGPAPILETVDQIIGVDWQRRLGAGLDRAGYHQDPGSQNE